MIAEGVETRDEALWLGRLGLIRQQGFFYARPAVASLGSDLTPRLEELRDALAADSTPGHHGAR